MPASAQETGRYTESQPYEGLIVHKNHEDLTLLEFVSWDEGDECVVRAADFDLYAVGSDRPEAVAKLVKEAYSLFFALGGLVDRDEATDDERDLFIRLGAPIVDAFERNEKRRRARFIALSFPRFQRRGDSRSDWRPGSSRARSPLASIA